MEAFKFVAKIIVIIIIVKVVFFLGAQIPKRKIVEKPAIERFLNEFVINNSQFKYPIKLDDVTTLINRKLIKEGGIYFVVEYLQMNVARETFTIPYQEVGELVKKQVSPQLCQDFKENHEKLFKGYSQVGLIQKYVDINNNFVAEIRFHISSC